MPHHLRLPRATWSVLLDQALDGLRQGGVPPWPYGRWPRLRQRLEDQWLGSVWGTWGDRVASQDRWSAGVKLLLHWVFGLIRPDHQCALGLSLIPNSAWVDQTTWRPFLAVAVTSGLIPVPDMPQLYRRTSGESTHENLSGLWAVGTSTTYRYIEKGRRLLGDALYASQCNAQQLWALRDVAANVQGMPLEIDWHQKQGYLQAQQGHAINSAWHFARAQQWIPLAELLQRRALELASSVEHEALLLIVKHASVDACDRLSLALGESMICRCLGDAESELKCLQLALRTAELLPEQARPFGLGQALYALGYYLNARDPEQAIGHLEAAAHQLLLASQVAPVTGQDLIQCKYVATLATLAFVLLRRNSPQATSLLRNATVTAKECSNLNIEAQGMLLKVQAEEARCQDRLDDALRLRQQTLVLYERAGDLKEVVESHCNIGQLLAQAGRPEDAKRACNRVIEMARRFSIRPETLLSAHGGIAVAHMTLHEFDSAVSHLHQVLHISERFGLPVHRYTGLINLAEVHYLQFKNQGNPINERLGDQYAEQGRALACRLGLTQLESKAQSLKQATLNPQTAVHHLLPIETSAHPGEFAKIEALRAELALPRPPAQRARTHIALSQLYLRIAAKERDAARGLMQTHGLGELESDIEALQQTWAHDGNLASQLSSRWREQVGDWLTDSQRKAVLERLLAEGSLSKSSYGEAAEVSPATASKHLGLLADKGLLEQQGRGPATRYVLPSSQNSGSRDGAAPSGSPGSVH